jgi:hypothetical protein
MANKNLNNNQTHNPKSALQLHTDTLLALNTTLQLLEFI